MPEQGQASLAAAPQNAGFVYDSDTVALIPLVVKNAILNILTLTIYRFWAKTAVRRHLWRNTRFQEDAVEYTGVGKELFLGFLLVLFVVILPLAIANEVLIGILGPDSFLQILGFGFILFLIGVAQYRARRYRLSRTTWRGIRAAQTGSPWLYGVKRLGFWILFPFTLGWSYPWQRIHLSRFEMSNTLFGNRPFTFDGDAAALYRRFIGAWGTFIILSAVMIVGIFAFFEVTPAFFDVGSFKTADNIDMDAKALTGILLIALTPYVVALFAFAGFKAREFAYVAASVKYEGLSFSFDCDTWSLIKLVMGNFFITLFTLGFGLPFAQMRKFRYFCDRIAVQGEADFDAIRQSTEERDALGEGLADAFDIGDF